MPEKLPRPLWELQRVPGLASAKRRFTGSYEVASFKGNAFPTTSWVADSPTVIDVATYRLVLGDRRLSLQELHDGPDPGAPASTVWSSFTPRGRGS